MIQGWHIALLLKPLGLLLMFAPGAFIVYYVKRRMPDCRLKRFLLTSWKV